MLHSALVGKMGAKVKDITELDEQLSGMNWPENPEKGTAEQEVVSKLYLKENPQVGDTLQNPDKECSYSVTKDLGETDEAQTYFAEDDGGGKKVLKVMDVPRKTLDWQFRDALASYYLQTNAALGTNTEVFSLNKFKVVVVNDYIEGRNLDEEIKRRNRVFSEEETLDFLVDVLENDLAKLHRQKLVHRDIKPKNVIVQEQQDDTFKYRLIDFGILREHDASVTMTVSHRASRTFTKERDQGTYKSSDDFYSLARTAYALLKGRYPAILDFGLEEEIEEIDRKQFGNLPVSERLQQVLLKMQGYDGSYNSCEQIVEDLRNPDNVIEPVDESLDFELDPEGLVDKVESGETEENTPKTNWLGRISLAIAALAAGVLFIPVEKEEVYDVTIQSASVLRRGGNNYDQNVLAEDESGRLLLFENNYNGESGMYGTKLDIRGEMERLAKFQHKVSVVARQYKSLTADWGYKTVVGWSPVVQEHTIKAKTKDGKEVEINYKCKESNDLDEHGKFLFNQHQLNEHNTKYMIELYEFERLQRRDEGDVRTNLQKLLEEQAEDFGVELLGYKWTGGEST